eukprot:1332122-Amorphochlora_amoeboformis.AAC.1
MGVVITIHNDTKFNAIVAIHLKGGIRLCSRKLRPGEAWIKRDGGISAGCPYDLRVRKIGERETEWVLPIRAPPLQGQLEVYMSKVAVKACLKQRRPLGHEKKMHERVDIAHKWVQDEERASCAQCGRLFNLYWRKHHCRICGDIFCDECSSVYSARFRVLTALHPTMPARACFGCYEKHKEQENAKEDSTEATALPGPEEEKSSVMNGAGSAGAPVTKISRFLEILLHAPPGSVQFDGMLIAGLMAWCSAVIGVCV